MAAANCSPGADFIFLAGQLEGREEKKGKASKLLVQPEMGGCPYQEHLPGSINHRAQRVCGHSHLQ